MTELTPSTMTTMPDNNKIGNIGKSLGNVIVKIVDENNKILPPNKKGKLLIHSETQMEGYYQNKEVTQTVLIDFDGEKYIKTEDIGYQDEEGFYYIDDRAKEMIIHRMGTMFFHLN